MRVGLFDSGIGGLTVLKTLMKKYPQCDYIYYGDTLNVPYGNKTKEELIILAKNNIEFLLSKNVDFVIIACGTVSSNCLDYLKDNYQIPIIDVITPTINYLNNSEYKNILVIATSATVNSGIFNKNVKKKITTIEAPLLASLIEQNDNKNITNILHNYLDKYIDNIDALVLGCTHYPIIISKIKNVINKDIPIINMANYLNLDNIGNSKLEIYFSKLNDNIIKNTKKILNNNAIIIKNSK